MAPSTAPAPVASAGPDADTDVQPTVVPAVDPDVTAAPSGVVDTDSDPDAAPDTDSAPGTDSPEIPNTPSIPVSTPTAPDDDLTPGGLLDKPRTF